MKTNNRKIEVSDTKQDWTGDDCSAKPVTVTIHTNEQHASVERYTDAEAISLLQQLEKRFSIRAYTVLSRREITRAVQIMDEGRSFQDMKMSDCVVLDGRTSIDDSGATQFTSDGVRRP